VTFPPHFTRVDDPRPALELQPRDGGPGHLVTVLPYRMRIRYRKVRPALLLETIPRTGCADCRGAGGDVELYRDQETGEVGHAFVACPCWRPYDPPVLTARVPLWVARRWLGYRGPAQLPAPHPF
jgi:hypothetical protein